MTQIHPDRMHSIQKNAVGQAVVVRGSRMLQPIEGTVGFLNVIDSHVELAMHDEMNEEHILWMQLEAYIRMPDGPDWDTHLLISQHLEIEIEIPKPFQP